MSALFKIFSVLLLGSIGFSKVVQLKYEPSFLLQLVLEKKNLKMESSKAAPQIKFKSQTKLKDFQDDVEPQWGFRPDQITNVYIVAKNLIYLMDDSDYYEKTKRCLDDSLVHELVHFVQVQYQGWDLADESLEWDAIEIQTAFREKYCPVLYRFFVE